MPSLTARVLGRALVVAPGDDEAARLLALFDDAVVVRPDDVADLLDDSVAAVAVSGVDVPELVALAESVRPRGDVALIVDPDERLRALLVDERQALLGFRTQVVLATDGRPLVLLASGADPRRRAAPLTAAQLAPTEANVTEADALRRELELVRGRLEELESAAAATAAPVTGEVQDSRRAGSRPTLASTKVLAASGAVAVVLVSVAAATLTSTGYDGAVLTALLLAVLALSALVLRTNRRQAGRAAAHRRATAKADEAARRQERALREQVERLARHQRDVAADVTAVLAAVSDLALRDGGPPGPAQP